MKVSYKGFTAEEWADHFDEVREANRAMLERLDEAVRDLERARTFTGLEAEGCPLCTYKEGVFIAYCSLHRQLHEKELQVDAMRDVVDAACAYESFMGFDDLNSAYRNRREATDAFVKAVAAYKTRLPEKRKDECAPVRHEMARALERNTCPVCKQPVT
jgi:hypothetical protein